MRIFLTSSIILLSIIIIVELIFIFTFFKTPSGTQKEPIQNIDIPTPTLNVKQIIYQPERQYTGRVISLTTTTEGDYLYELTYTNQDNLKAIIKYDSDDISKITIQYINNQSETIEEKHGLELNSLQFQDKFDMMISYDTGNDLNKPNDMVVKSILLKVYRE